MLFIPGGGTIMEDGIVLYLTVEFRWPNKGPPLPCPIELAAESDRSRGSTGLIIRLTIEGLTKRTNLPANPPLCIFPL